jgi:hypothetical protein
VILCDLAGEILLALENIGDVALELDDFARYGTDWTGPHEGTGDQATESGGAKDGDVADAH